tara:strand:+ start:1136 stop:1768 length:633 start_codon:yes stop_codon:yes gene_type:complete
MKDYLINKKYIWWDFDGVIKESLDVKTQGFNELFKPYGKEIVNKVVNHHKLNGGVSRFKKIPLYLKWANLKTNPETVDIFCHKFSKLVKKTVIESNWVPGAYEFLKLNHDYYNFFLVSATPQKEIEDILKELKINNFFKEIFGSPSEKEDVINLLIKKYNVSLDSAILIGDSESDLIAAQNAGIDFLLRKTFSNDHLQEKFSGPKIDNFL